MPESHLRASDADRATVATALGQHMAAGRLTVDEYDERLARAYAAKTYGELDELTADLPANLPAAGRPAGSPIPGPRGDGSAHRSPAGVCSPGGDLRSAWQAWATTSLIVLTVWLATSMVSGLHYFWPVWVFGPWGAVLLVRTLADGGSWSGRGRRS